MASLLVVPAHRAALLVGLALALSAGYVVVAASVAAGPCVVDRAVWGWAIAHRSAWGDAVLVEISNVGAPVVMAFLAVVAALALWARRRPGAGLVLLSAEAGARIAAELLKSFHARARPPAATALMVEVDPALPSAHALESSVVLGLLGLLVGGAVASHLSRVAVAAATVCAVGSIGASRIYLGVHWASDVVAGWLLGGALLAVCVVMLSWADRRPPATAGCARPPVLPARRDHEEGDVDRTDPGRPVTGYGTGGHRS